MHGIRQLRDTLEALGAKPEHVSHLLRSWLQLRPLGAGRRAVENYLPRAVREAWPGIQAELTAAARLRSEHPGSDGSSRLLLELRDGQAIEAVLLPTRSDGDEKAAGGLCVSTQVGCAVACSFCKTGEGGLLRQMGSLEIAAQLALARTRRAVNKVVFMGMGEPAHNLDAVLDAIQLMGQEGGIGHKNLVLSTVGDERLFQSLQALVEAGEPGIVKPALALSLHTSSDARRATLLPKAPRVPVADLVARGDRYARTSGYPMQVQWTLIAGVNDGDDELDGIIALLRGRHAILNMIPYNHVEGFAHRRPDDARCTEIFQTLNRRGVLTRLRQSAGQDVEAGCGQLRSRAASTPPVVRLLPEGEQLSRSASSP